MNYILVTMCKALSVNPAKVVQSTCRSLSVTSIEVALSSMCEALSVNPPTQYSPSKRKNRETRNAVYIVSKVVEITCKLRNP